MKFTMTRKSIYMKGSAWRYALTVLILLLFSGNRLLLAQPVQIGDLITFADGSKGIVCYVDPANDQKGWVVAMDDLGPSEWSMPGDYVPTTRYYQLFTTSNGSIPSSPSIPNQTYSNMSLNNWEASGKSNTLALFQMKTGNHYSPAARAANPESGWYIPDADQMMKLLSMIPMLEPAFERAGVGDINILYYAPHWTSTRYNNTSFYYLQGSMGSDVNNQRLTTRSPYQSCYVRLVRDFDFGSEPLVYWAIQPKEDSIRVSPPVTTAYDALVIYGTDTFTVQSHVIVHPTYNKDTIFGDTVYAYEDFEKIVHGYTFNVTGAGDYALYDTFPTIYGCDSILTIMLRVRAPKELAYYDTVCQSQVHNYSDGPNDAVAIALFGQSALDSLVRVSGQLIKEKVYMKDESGNDSIVSFYLTVKAKRNDTTAVVTNFHGDTYFWNDSLYTEPGSHTVYTQLTDGCDFYDVLHLVILDIDTSENVICLGDNTDLVITVTQRKGPNDTIPRYPRVGDVLCTDGTTMHPDSFLLSSKTAMGVVVSANPRDGFGRAVALSKSSSNAKWGPCDGHSLTPTDNSSDAMNDMDGAGNTANIIATGTPSEGYWAYCAVGRCYLYNPITNDDGPNPNGWYLPAAGEMMLVYANRVQINNTLIKLGKSEIQSGWPFWTSTEYHLGSCSAWLFGGTGNYHYDLKADYTSYASYIPFTHFSLP